MGHSRDRMRRRLWADLIAIVAPGLVLIAASFFVGPMPTPEDEARAERSGSAADRSRRVGPPDQ